MDNKTLLQPTASQEEVAKWFPSFVDELNNILAADRLMLETNTAPLSKLKFLESLMKNDKMKTLEHIHKSSSVQLVKKLMIDYFKELQDRSASPHKLAIGLFNSQVLVWSEIDDDDEKTEDALLLAEAKVNSEYYSYGFYINTTVIEKSDNLSIPPHYQTIIN